MIWDVNLFYWLLCYLWVYKIYFQIKKYKTTLRWKVCHGIFVVGTYTSYYKRSIIKYFIFLIFFLLVFHVPISVLKRTLCGWYLSRYFFFSVGLFGSKYNRTRYISNVMYNTCFSKKKKKTVVYVIMLLSLKTLSWLWPKCFHVEYLWG